MLLKIHRYKLKDTRPSIVNSMSFFFVSFRGLSANEEEPMILSLLKVKGE